MASAAGIVIKKLTMRYGAFTALKEASFSVRHGEILGLLGPNGAGKTTLMRVLTTFLYPSGGTASVNGHDILKDPLSVRRAIGYLPETAPLYLEMQVDEYLVFVGRARGVSAHLMTERLEWLKRSCGLKPVWRHALSELSKGYRQRVGLAQALIHDPAVLILDEPTSGLDPLQIIGIRNLIRSLAEEKTIIFSTHILQEVETLADRIVIINDGAIVANGTREEITKRAATAQQVRVAVRAERDEAQKALSALDACENIRYEGAADGGAHRFLLRGRTGLSLVRSVDDLAKRRQWPLMELHEQGASLEEAFIALLSANKPL